MLQWPASKLTPASFSLGLCTLGLVAFHTVLLCQKEWHGF